MCGLRCVGREDFLEDFCGLSLSPRSSPDFLVFVFFLCVLSSVSSYSLLSFQGKVLIPVFAVGRAQELCMLLENYWERMHLQFPIYFAGGMTEKANAYYRLYVHWSKAGIMNLMSNSNGEGKHVQG